MDTTYETAAKVECKIDGVMVETEYLPDAFSARDWAKEHATGRWRLIDGVDGEPGGWHDLPEEAR